MSQLTRSFNNLPVKQFFFLLSLLVLFLPAVVAGLILINFEIDKNRAQSAQYEQETVKILASAMKTHLYNFDKEGENPLIDHMLLDRNIYSIRVYDFEGIPFFEKKVEEHGGDIHTLTHEIFYDDKVIGRVEVGFFEMGFSRFFDEYLRMYAVLSGILFSAIVVFYFFTNIKILTPVKYLKNQAQRLSNNQLDTPILTFNNDELGELAETFEHMRLSLKKHIQHLDTLVQERTRELDILNRYLEKRVTQQVEELRKKDHMLVQNAKMAAMGEMIGAIAHQWRQPISVMGMTANNIKVALAMDKEIPPRQLESYVDTVSSQVQHLSKTIDDFRNFFSPSKEKKNFTPCEYIADVYKLMEVQMLNHNIILHVNEHEHFFIYGYPNEFKQVILNLFNNAQYAMAAKKISDGRIEVFIDNDGVTGTMKIRDNGGGIPDELLPSRLFEPYVTTKGDQGTGIGLQISKTIIESHMEGTLRAHNVEGGAEFVIRLPIAGMHDDHHKQAPRKEHAFTLPSPLTAGASTPE